MRQELHAEEGSRQMIEVATKRLLEAIGEDVNRPGLRETPYRVSKMWIDELSDGYQGTLEEVLTTTFPADYDEIVLLKDITFWSFCEHHIVPFFGVAHVAYIPDGKVIGLSKIARLVEKASRRLNIQEQLTVDIANAMHNALHPLGVGVIIEAEHLCMTMRGIQKPGMTTTTSVMKGAFMRNPGAREELMGLIYNGR